MTATIPLEKMTTQEKLRALEYIWDDLQRNPEDIPSPEWHADKLEKRESLICEGKATFSDWNEAKQRIRDKIK